MSSSLTEKFKWTPVQINLPDCICHGPTGLTKRGTASLLLQGHPLCSLHASAPTTVHQALQELINFSYLIGHQAEHYLDQCSHLMLPPESSGCTVTHTMKRPAGSFCGTGVQQLCTGSQNHSHCFATPSSCIVSQPQISRHAKAMKPLGGFFLQIQFLPRVALFLLWSWCMPANLGQWNRAFPPGGTTACGNAWFSNGDVALFN